MVGAQWRIEFTGFPRPELVHSCQASRKHQCRMLAGLGLPCRCKAARALMALRSHAWLEKHGLECTKFTSEGS